ncbi:MAG: hypothetical protein AB7H70_18005 [Rhodospirillaceae bacterium]
MSRAFALAILFAGVAAGAAQADVTISYNEYSESPTVGRGSGTSTNPKDAGYGAMRIFIEKVLAYTDDKGADALPAGQQVIFKPDNTVNRGVNALRAGIQFGKNDGQEKPAFNDPSWGFIYNSVPFGITFDQMVAFLTTAKVDAAGHNGTQLAQQVLDSRGGTQIVIPVVGSTAQNSGFFPKPMGTAQCEKGDAECLAQKGGVGLAGLCTSGWRIRYLSPPQDVVDRACDILVERGTIKQKTLTYYPAVGGQPVLLPMQTGAIQGFEYINPSDDLVDFFPVKEATSSRPLGNPDSGDLDCTPAVPFPIPAGTKSACTQNIGQMGARYAHTPAWHQPSLVSWMHIDKAVWNGLNDAQKAAIQRAAKESVTESYKATESIQCERLEQMLALNSGVMQRNHDGSQKLVDGKPVSAKMTLAKWPDADLKLLKQATDEYFAKLEGGPETNVQKTDAQKDFSIIAMAWKNHAKAVGGETFKPGAFPAPGCKLVK